jgi:hypothetical protein
MSMERRQPAEQRRQPQPKKEYALGCFFGSLPLDSDLCIRVRSYHRQHWFCAGLEGLSMSVGQKTTRSFGAGDRPRCPQCGKTMSLSRRTPHSELGASYERQTFTCYDCVHDIERSADMQGKPHE